MKHATGPALDTLEPLLCKIRKRNALKERKRGVFYRRSAPFLHFHEDAAGMFADIRLGPGWERVRVTTQREQRQLLSKVDRELAE